MSELGAHLRNEAVLYLILGPLLFMGIGAIIAWSIMRRHK